MVLGRKAGNQRNAGISSLREMALRVANIVYNYMKRSNAEAAHPLFSCFTNERITAHRFEIFENIT